MTGDENSIVEIANYQTGDKDFSAILTNIKAKNPDAIFAPGNFTESALLVKQARQLGIEAPLWAAIPGKLRNSSMLAAKMLKA